MNIYWTFILLPLQHSILPSYGNNSLIFSLGANNFFPCPYRGNKIQCESGAEGHRNQDGWCLIILTKAPKGR